MQFVAKDRIITTRDELKALITFAGKDDNFGNIAIRVEGKRLIASATDGSSAVFHHGTVDPNDYGQRHQWQIHRMAIECVVKIAGRADEVQLVLTKDGGLGRVLIKDIESGDEKTPNSNFAGFVSEQLSIAGMKEPPVVMEHREALTRILLNPDIAKKLPSVAKAANSTDLFSLYAPKDGSDLVLCVFDAPESVADGTGHSWVAAFRQAEGWE